MKRRIRFDQTMFSAAQAGVETLESRRLFSFAAISGSTLLITGTAQSDSINVFPSSTGVIAVYESNQGLDTFSTDGISRVSISSSDGSDSITLDASLQVVFSEIDIQVGNGNDTVLGNDANRHAITYGSGQSLLVGGAGSDTVSVAQELISSSVGATVRAGSGNDSISGSSHALLNGQQGDDTIVCAGASATVHGGQGNDSIVGAGVPNGNSLAGGPGDDTLANTSLLDVITGGIGSNETLPTVQFVSTGTFAGAQLPDQLKLADLNGDDNLDLVETNTKNDSLRIQLGNGDGTFAAPITISLGTAPEEPFHLEIANVTGDGSPDILVSTAYTSTHLFVIQNNGDGTFAAPLDTGIPDGNVFTTADVNNDGRIDIAVAVAHQSGPQSFVAYTGVYLGNGDGTFRSPSTQVVGGGDLETFPESITTGDINGDGKLDLVLTTQTPAVSVNDDLQVLLGNNDGTFGLPVASAAGVYGSSIAVADFNGDGKADIVIDHGQNTAGEATTQELSIDVLVSNGDGHFHDQALSIGTLLDTNHSSQVVVADFNADGRQDILLSSPSDGSVRALINDGHANFLPLAFGAAGNGGLIAVGDLNSDGKLDIVESIGNRRLGIQTQSFLIPR